MKKEAYKFYVTSCHKNGGIYHCEFKNGKVEIKNKTPLSMPMYMAIDKEKAYVILREPFNENNYSGIVSFDIEDGELKNQGDIISTDGVVACHLCVLNDSVYCANYLSGSATKLGEKVVTHSGEGINPKRQDMPHTHYINSFDGKYLLCTDLGTDEIYTYDKDLNEISKVSVPSGHGARHLAIDHGYVYCVNELLSTVSYFKYNDGTLEYIDTVAALPEGVSVANTAAAIRIKDNYLYVSHRGHDSITIFTLIDHKPEFLANVSCGGSFPRDFNIFDDLLVCTNEKSNSITFFSISDGIPKKLDCELNINAPLCVIEEK